MPTQIFILFSVASDYDQPDRAFECWWEEKPSIEAVAKALGVDFEKAQDTLKAAVVSIWLGESKEIHETQFWIESVPATPQT